MANEMVKVLLYDNGDVEIESAESYRITQSVHFSSKKCCGQAYYCKKGMESFYLKKMLSKRKKELAKQIEKLKAVEIRINNKLSELKGENK